MRKWIYIVLIVVFAVIFLISGGLLLDYYLDNQKAADDFNQIAHIVEQVKTTKPTVSPGETEPEAVLTEVQHPETGETVMVLPEYAEIFIMNPDTVGWISIADTRVNYPVMHHPEEKDYYLYKDFYKKYSSNGSIYIREACDVFQPTDNVTIYGHRMNSGAMFADLLKYKDEQFYIDHPHIQFDTLRERHYYVIMSVFTISASLNNGFQYHLMADAADEAEFDAFVEQCHIRALYDTGVTAVYGDKLITLSTCELGDSSRRVVVVAKRIA